VRLLAGQYLPTGCGFSIVRIVDKNAGHVISPTAMPRYCDLRNWCKQNCSSIWGYSTSHEFTWTDSDDWKSSGRIVHYFAFSDMQDVTMVGLYLGLQDFTPRAMWPSSAKFNIYVPDELF